MTGPAEAQVPEAESPLGDVNTQLQVRSVEQRLTRDFAQCVSADVVRRCVQDAETSLGQPRFFAFVPILVERGARRRILAWAADQGTLLRDGVGGTQPANKG